MKMINADQITTNMNGSTLEIFIDGKLAAEISDGKTELGFVYDVLQGMDYEINEDNFVLRAFNPVEELYTYRQSQQICINSDAYSRRDMGYQAMVMEMLRAGSIEDEDDPRPSPLDQLFNELSEDYPDHIALKYYRSYHSGSAKTLKSIQITLAARLEKFNLESLAALTSTDELDLGSLGEKKTALLSDEDFEVNQHY